MDRFKFRVFAPLIQNYSYFSLEEIIKVNTDYFIQQCLGVKDNTGRLIYEGDLVLINDHLAEVVWFPFSCCFDVVYQRADNKNEQFVNWDECTVVGSLAPDLILNLEGEVLTYMTTVEELYKVLGITEHITV